MKTNTRSTGALSKKAVMFTRRLLQAGVSSELLGDLNRPLGTEMSEYIEMSLILGLLGRLEDINYDFAPLALGWRLTSLDSRSINLELPGQYSSRPPSDFTSQHNLKQMQPKLETTEVSIIEALRTEGGTKQLRTLFQHSTPEHSGAATEIFHKNQTGLGIGHALEVVDAFCLRPLQAIQSLVPLQGFKMFGRSMFILLDYICYKDFHDTKGTRVCGWWEIRTVDDEGPKKFSTVLHTDLQQVIPKGSLIVIANHTWFKKSAPTSN